jgi:hypothetical protein
VNAAQGHGPARRYDEEMVPRTRRARALAGAILAVACVTAFPACAGSKPRDARKAELAARPFAASSFWNAPLAADAPLDRLSPVYAAELRAQVARTTPWINTTRFSVPVYTVPAGRPTVRVALDTRVSPALQAAFERVPLPAGARPAAGSDATLVVWQPSTDRMWEFWRAQRRDDGWHAAWGGYMPDVSASPGHYVDPPRWGASATSLPVLGGLMRISELRAQRIDHALALAIPDVRAGAWSWPAQRTDGKDPSPLAIPAGTRFRIDPRADLDKLPMTPLVRAMAKAAQRYGMVVRDTGSNVAFYAEDPTPTGSDPYTGDGGIFGGRYPSALLRQFPWQYVQALRGR